MTENRDPYTDYTFCDACGSASTGLQFTIHVIGDDMGSMECPDCGAAGKLRPADDFEIGIMGAFPSPEGGEPYTSACTIASIEDAAANGTKHLLVAVPDKDIPGFSTKGQAILFGSGHPVYFLVVVAPGDHDTRWGSVKGLPSPRVHKIGKTTWYIYTK